MWTLFAGFITLAFALSAQTPSTAPACPAPPAARAGTATDKTGKETRFVNLAGAYGPSSSAGYVRTPGELVFSGVANGCESDARSFSKALYVLVGLDRLAAVKIGSSWSPTTVELTFTDGTQESFKCSGVTTMDVYVSPSIIMRLNGDQVLGMEIKFDPPADPGASGQAGNWVWPVSASAR